MVTFPNPPLLAPVPTVPPNIRLDCTFGYNTKIIKLDVIVTQEGREGGGYLLGLRVVLVSSLSSE